MNLSDKKGVQDIVLTLAKLGLKEVIICPGSRNAPLTISFNRHPAFRCTSIRDERSAAFFALGKAAELKNPVAIVCTSGSASLNFAPAVSEAYYQRIPLIIITADRPKEWTGQGDGQTINQTNIYKNFIRKSYELKGDAANDTELWYNERCLCEGYNSATVSDRGPVHFNIPLSEPLYNTTENIEIIPKIFREYVTEKQLPEEVITTLSEGFNKSKKVLVLVGQNSPNPTLTKELVTFAQNENVIILTESTSNLHHPLFIENIDRCITNLTDEEAKRLSPELLITIGGAVVSKRIKALLRKYKAKYHWNIHSFNATMDTYQSLTDTISMKPENFFSQFLKTIQPVQSDYRKNWLLKKEKLAALHDEFCKDCAYSDFKVFYKIYKYIPENICLHLSNSSPIRYAQLFDNSRIAESRSNRGTSGIDGCTSTAMGAASASPEKDFLLITGDIAFNYDVNALWHDKGINNLKIIIINNGGGNIFRIIPGPGSVTELEPFFETSVQSNAVKIAEHFHWNYLSADDENSLDTALKTFFKKEEKRIILEIFTDAKTNPAVLEKYWNNLKKASEPFIKKDTLTSQTPSTH